MNRLNPVRLFAGTSLLSIVYGFLSPEYGSDLYFWLLPVEAAAYISIILFSYRANNGSTWVKAIIFAAASNSLLTFLWPFIAVIPAAASMVFGLSNQVIQHLFIAFYSAIGSITCCCVLALSVSNSLITRKMLKISTILSFFAGLPFLSPDSTLFIAAHKATWWFMFALSLYVTHRINTSDESASRTMENALKIDSNLDGSPQNFDPNQRLTKSEEHAWRLAI